jgi:DNA-binding NarL/FixJ family response regulator
MALTILVADNHAVFRRGLVEVLRADPAFDSLIEAADGAEALRLIIEMYPSVAVLDIHMPLLSGFQVASIVRQANLRTALVFVTAYRDQGMLEAAASHGVNVYILKDDAVREIRDGVRAAIRRETFVSPEFLEYIRKKGPGKK